MNFQQLRIIRETVRRNFNLTEVANALYTSQSGVCKHIKDLEDELGVELFVRRGKRLLGLTEPGKELVGDRRAHPARHAATSSSSASSSPTATQGQLDHRHHAHAGALRAAAGGARDFRQAFPERAPRAAPGAARPRSSRMLQSTARPTSASPPRRSTAMPALVTFPFYTGTTAVVVPAGHPLERGRGR